MKKSYARENENEEGQGLVEYALILVLVAVVVIVALNFLGGAVSNTFGDIFEILNGDKPGACETYNGVDVSFTGKWGSTDNVTWYPTNDGSCGGSNSAQMHFTVYKKEFSAEADAEAYCTARGFTDGIIIESDFPLSLAKQTACGNP